MTTLAGAATFATLASRTRPQSMGDIVGNTHIFDSDAGLLTTLYQAADRNGGLLPSVIVYGPPGVAKTSFAYLYGRTYDARTYETREFQVGKANAANIDGLLREIADQRVSAFGAKRRIVLVINEVHRLTIVQQDRILAAVEDGVLVIVGTTTENPYRAVSEAIRSRCNLLEFRPLTPRDTLELFVLALNRFPEMLDASLPKGERVDGAAIARLALSARGDGRLALNMLGQAVDEHGRITMHSVARAQQVFACGRCGTTDQENVKYESTSGLIKSIRASDPQGAVFYAAMLIHAGVDFKYICRRLIVSASEDVGLADPNALIIAEACYRSCETVGYPECEMFIAQCAIYLAQAPKSNAAYRALQGARTAIQQASSEDCRPPEGYRSASAGPQYVYPHDFGGYVLGSVLPEKFARSVFYFETAHYPPGPSEPGALCGR